MSKSVFFVAMAFSLAQGLAVADEIVEVRQDRMVGGGFGGLSGFMLGAAAGGPIGAVVGGGLGYFAGQGVQEAAGLDHTLYVVKAEDGSVSRVRSASAGLIPGQQVDRDGSRLAAVVR